MKDLMWYYHFLASVEACNSSFERNNPGNHFYKVHGALTVVANRDRVCQRIHRLVSFQTIVELYSTV